MATIKGTPAQYVYVRTPAGKPVRGQHSADIDPNEIVLDGTGTRVTDARVLRIVREILAQRDEHHRQLRAIEDRPRIPAPIKKRARTTATQYLRALRPARSPKPPAI